MSRLLSILAGAGFVLHGAGKLENSLAVSYEKILIDEEIIRLRAGVNSSHTKSQYFDRFLQQRIRIKRLGHIHIRPDLFAPLPVELLALGR